MNTYEQTTLICLFHHPDKAEAALNDLEQAGIPRDSIGVMKDSGAADNRALMTKWNVPERDVERLSDGIKDGGVVLAVSAGDELADEVETIFKRHQASQIDETETDSAPLPLAAAAMPVANTSAGGKIDVIEEEMTVGKRAVERGGVRVVQRVVEEPVSETVNLREEHVTVERHAVNRDATAAELAFKDREFEVTESAEEAVVSKSARVVEEVLVGKESLEHTETVRGTVRKTDVVVENIETPVSGNTPVRK